MPYISMETNEVNVKRQYLQNNSVDGGGDRVAEEVLPRGRPVERRDLARSHRKQVLPTVQVQCQVGGLSSVVSLGTEPHEDGRGNAPLLAVNSIREGRRKVLPSVLLSGALPSSLSCKHDHDKKRR